VAFHEALRGADGRFDADVLAAMRRAAVPIAWVEHKEQRCLVFEWIENDPERAATGRDVQQLRAQLDVIHALGFCHLDVTQRNILLTEDTAILMDYDCVTRIGTVPLCGIAPENCARVKRRDKVRVEDDEHLWRLLFPDAAPGPAPAVAAASNGTAALCCATSGDWLRADTPGAGASPAGPAVPQQLAKLTDKSTCEWSAAPSSCGCALFTLRAQLTRHRRPLKRTAELELLHCCC
jgi:hypothetical protein